VVSLGIRGVLKAGPEGRRRALSTTLAAIVLAYLPISDALTKAGERWGVDVGLSDPLALLRVFTDAAAIWIRGWESLLPTVAALTGLALASRRNRDLTHYLALAWSVPGSVSGRTRGCRSTAQLPVPATHIRPGRRLRPHSGAPGPPSSGGRRAARGLRMEYGDLGRDLQAGSLW